MEEVFAHVARTPDREFAISVAYLEIYNENVRDLLNPGAKLDVVEGLQGVEVKGSKPEPVADLSAVRGLARIRTRLGDVTVTIRQLHSPGAPPPPPCCPHTAALTYLPISSRHASTGDASACRRR